MPRNTQVFAPTFSGEGIVRWDDITHNERYGHNSPRKGMPGGYLPVLAVLVNRDSSATPKPPCSRSDRKTVLLNLPRKRQSQSPRNRNRPDVS
jgi:hypothetical protein